VVLHVLGMDRPSNIEDTALVDILVEFCSRKTVSIRNKMASDNSPSLEAPAHEPPSSRGRARGATDEVGSLRGGIEAPHPTIFCLHPVSDGGEGVEGLGGAGVVVDPEHVRRLGLGDPVAGGTLGIGQGMHGHDGLVALDLGFGTTVVVVAMATTDRGAWAGSRIGTGHGNAGGAIAKGRIGGRRGHDRWWHGGNRGGCGNRHGHGHRGGHHGRSGILLKWHVSMLEIDAGHVHRGMDRSVGARDVLHRGNGVVEGLWMLHAMARRHTEG